MMGKKSNKKINFAIAVKAFIVDNKNRLLILKRRSNDVQKPRTWEIPGGRLNPGEDPFIGLKRETKEETSLDIKIIRPLTIRYFTRKDKQIIIMIIFLCKPIGGSIKLSKEHSDFFGLNLNIPEEVSKYFKDSFFMKEINAFKKI